MLKPGIPGRKGVGHSGLEQQPTVKRECENGPSTPLYSPRERRECQKGAPLSSPTNSETGEHSVDGVPCIWAIPLINVKNVDNSGRTELSANSETGGGESPPQGPGWCIININPQPFTPTGAALTTLSLTSLTPTGVGRALCASCLPYT